MNITDKTACEMRAHDMEERLVISFEWCDSVLCGLIAGRLDAKTSDSFVQKADLAISEPGRVPDALILDCSALEYVSGLGWLCILRLGYKLRGCGARLLVAGLSNELHDVLGQCHNFGLVAIHRTMSDAHGSRGCRNRFRQETN